jgi:hypothetical protein
LLVSEEHTLSKKLKRDKKVHQPQLVEVDPHLVKFNVTNPRKHRGTEFLRLRKSIEDVGVVQMPTVRVLSGGFYECIDGEGRIQAAQEARLKSIWVVSYGLMSDREALTMLQAANAVRSFGFLIECRGLANLHRQGETHASLANKFGVSKSQIQDMVSIGYFPEELHTLILDDITQSEEHANRWTHALLSQLLPLRQELLAKDLSYSRKHGLTLDDKYDYREVRLAIEKVLRGEIPDAPRMTLYVAQRRLELYQERFDQELQTHLKTELTQAKQAIEESYAQKLQGAQEETARLYDAQVKLLGQQLADLEKQYQEVVREVAKRPEIVAQREKDLQQKIRETERERLRLLELQQQAQKEASIVQQCLLEDMRHQLEVDKQAQQAAIEQDLAKAHADLEVYYAQKDQERQLQVENSISQVVAHSTEVLSATRQSILHLTSPGIVKGLIWLKESEVVSLLAQMRIVRETLERAEEIITHGEGVSQSIDGRLLDGYKNEPLTQDMGV